MFDEDLLANPARPAPGVRLCALADLGESGAKSFRYIGERAPFYGFVLHHEGKVLAFVDPNQLYLATGDFICHKLEIANDLRTRLYQFADDSMSGRRVCLSTLGKERSPKMDSRSAGIVVGRSGSNGLRVLFDGRTFPVTLHLSYVELE